MNISDNCVEAARTSDRVLVRDSKDPNGPMLALTRGQWAMLLEQCRA